MDLQRTSEADRAPVPYDSVGMREGPSGPPPGEVQELSLRDILHALRRRIWLILGVAALTLGAVGWWVMNERTIYHASAVVQVTDTRQELTGLTGIPAAGRSGADPLATQLQVLQSRTVLGGVVDREGLRLQSADEELDRVLFSDATVAADMPPGPVRLWFQEDVVVAEAAGDTTAVRYGQPLNVAGARFTVPERPGVARAELIVLPRDEVIDGIAGVVGARLRNQTSIIDVSYRSHDPERAPRVVNALVEEFARHSARTEQEESRRRRVFLEEQLAQVDSLLAVAQAALTDFRSQEGVYSSREQGAAQQSGLLDLQMRREELAADRRMYESLLNALNEAGEADRERQIRTLVSAPDIASNPVVSQLYGQLIRYAMTRDSLVAGDWGSARTSPDVVRLERLLDNTRSQLLDAVRSHMTAVDARLAALDELESRTATDLRTLPALEAREARLAQQVETVQRTAEQLRQEHQEARIAEAVETGDVEIIDRASRASPVDDRRTMKLSLGLLLGLMLGGSLAMVLESVNTSIRTRDDVERVLGLKPLGLVPRLELGSNGAHRSLPLLGGAKNGGDRRATGKSGRELVMLHDNRSSGAEAYRTLRTSLLYSQLGEHLKTVVVTSSGEGEGKTTVASNLATTFAQQGVRVLVVDADLRKARLHRLFGQQREPGLTDWVRGTVGPEEAIRETEVKRLFVLPSGKLPPNPSEVLGSPQMRRLVETLREAFELVIFDTPPLLAAADAAVLGARADGVVLVVQAGESEQGAVREGVRQLERVRSRILGVVLNDPDSTAKQYGEYYHYAYYGENS